MSNPSASNQIVIEISDARKSFECAFRDGVSEKLFSDLSVLNQIPGWSVKYGFNGEKGCLDKSFVVIHHNKAKKTKDAKDAAEFLETSLRDILLFREILWRRPINYCTLVGSYVSDVYS